MAQKGFSVIFIILGLILVAGIAGGGYYLTRSFAPKPSANPAPSPSPSPSPSDETAHWKTYTDPVSGYTVKYPSTWTLTEGPKQGTGATFDYIYLHLKGVEGELEVHSANQLGGGCSVGYEKIQLKNTQATTCHYAAMENEGEHWDSIYYGRANGGTLITYATAFYPSKSTSGILLKVLGSIDIINKPPQDTSDWKIYTNNNQGFSFKYPDSYFKYQEEFADGIYLAPSKGEGGNGPKFLQVTDIWLNITVQTANNIKSIDDYLNQGDLYKNAQRTSALIDGVSGYLITYDFIAVTDNGPKAYNLERIVLRDGKIYKITLSSWNQETLNSRRSMFDQITSAFKFL